MANAPNSITFDLADNAVDFVLSAAAYVKAGTPRDLKYAILHCIAGLELILKERLVRHDWRQIFKELDQADEARLRSGDFLSVNLKSAWRRLGDEVGIALEEDDFDRVDELSKLRNRIQHFEITVTAQEAISKLAFALAFFIGFVGDHLDDLLDSNSEDIDAIHAHLRDFKEFAANRLAAIQGGLETAAVKIECPRCWQNTLVIGDYDDPRCYFCEAEFDAEELAADNSETQAVRCPDCGAETARVSCGEESMNWFCYRCGLDGTYRECPRGCGGIAGADGLPCSDCMDEWMRKND